MERIETDYLVIGSGAVGMAFADTIVEQTDRHVTIVDRRSKPGGHWNDAYPFVALHQPSSFYGVNSMPLGANRKDTQGFNEGFYELASGAEVSAYYEAVMRQRLIPSGRVRYLPTCDYRGDGVAVSLLSGAETEIAVRRKTVDAAYNSPAIPANHKRRFAVAEGVRVVVPGELSRLWLTPDRRIGRFVVLGAGKTAMDAVTWLLTMGAPADAIQWVKPRESWLLNRARTQPGMEFFDAVFGGQADQMEAFATATSVDDIFLRLERAGVMLRIDPNVMPTMFHYATISQGEIDLLRQVRDVVRKGRVRQIHRDRIVLDYGEVAATPDALYIDCTASAVEPKPSQPIFQGKRIVPQLVRAPQPAFSAALIAFVEANYETDEARNALCRPVPFPNALSTYPATNIVNMMNQSAWMGDEKLSRWLVHSRLDGFGKVAAAIDPDDQGKRATLNRLRRYAPLAFHNLQKLAAPP